MGLAGALVSNVNGTKWIRPEKRIRIYARDGWRCLWCRKHASEDVQLTLDHFLARAAGGKNDAENLITACYGCNSSRRHQPALSYAHEIGSLFRDAASVLDDILDALERPLPVFVP